MSRIFDKIAAKCISVLDRSLNQTSQKLKNIKVGAASACKKKKTPFEYPPFYKKSKYKNQNEGIILGFWFWLLKDSLGTLFSEHFQHLRYVTSFRSISRISKPWFFKIDKLEILKAENFIGKITSIQNAVH